MTTRKQCKHCPWRKDVVPDRDIPGGYSADAHRALSCTIADGATAWRGTRKMACHESPVGAERECVGWVMHQLGPSNNFALRLEAMDGRYRDFQTVGQQHSRFEDTLPKGRRR